MNTLVQATLLCLATLLPITTPAQTSLCPTAEQWLQRCLANSSVFHGRVRKCSDNFLVIELTTPDHRPMAFEVMPSGHSAFRSVGGVGLSPVINIASWEQAPKPFRDGLDKLLGCVEADGQLGKALHTSPLDVSRRVQKQSPSPPPIGWLWLLGITAAVIVLGGRLRGLKVQRRRRWLLFGALATVLIALWRWCLFPATFFHQNGHGPEWVVSSLGGTANTYGPGFREVFGWLHYLLPGYPDIQIFVCQALIAALIPVLVFVLAKVTGAKPAFAFVLALLVAIDPIAGRAGQSESYFALGTFFITLATTTLAVGGCNKELSNRRFLLALLAAAALIAQGSRVHPSLWLPSALAPTVLLFAQAPVVERLRRWALATLVIGVTTLLFCGSTIWQVTQRRLATAPDFAPSSSYLVQLFLGIVLDLLLFLLVMRLLRFLPFKMVLFAGLVGAAVIVADSAQSSLRFAPPIVVAAFHRLSLPLIIAPLVALANCHPKRFSRPWSYVVAAFAVVLLLWHSPIEPLPTDILEQQWMAQQREVLPDTAVVAYLSRVQNNCQTLPLFGQWHKGPAGRRRLQGRTDIWQGLPSHYLHSSLCSTAAGRSTCDEIAAEYRLRSIARIRVPAVPSIDGLPYIDDTVVLELFVVEGKR